MKKSNVLKNIIKVGAALFSLFAFAACEIGLGAAVDVSAPVVSVINPERTGYILEEFTVNGTAKDNIGVTSLSLQIEPLDNPTPENTIKFRINNNVWEAYDSTTDKWTSYDAALCTITGDNTNFEWSITYKVASSVSNGDEFMITTQVYDEANNESKDSKDERSVTIDKNEPVVTLISPATEKPYSAVETRSAAYTLKDNSVLQNLINGEFTVTGAQKEEGKLSDLIVYLDESQTTDLTNLSENAIVKQVITGDNLRNWSATFNLSTISGYEHNKKIVRIVTESHDQAGNIETVCQGWFVYWNDADIPWIVANFGGTGSYSNKIDVYPNCSLQGQAYDDDGLKQVEIKVFKDNETEPVKTEKLDLKSENYPKYKAWSVEALHDNCDFRVEVECEDINGKKSEKEIRYMAVKDINPPNIVIETDTKQPMLGDASGKITIKGYVTDDGAIDYVKLVRIKASTPAETIIKYYNSSYEAWTTTSGGTDLNGNKVWKIDLGDNISGDTTVKRKFSKDFNIFSDFGINGTTEKLNIQTFIIMAVDKGGTAKIDTFTYAGDTTVPTLTIDKLEVKKGSVTETLDFKYCNGVNEEHEKHPKMLKPFLRVNGAITDKIILSGTWNDNSTEVWSDKSKHSPITLTWEGVSASVTANPNGTWTTGEITPPDATTAIIEMQFSDYAGNIAKANENFYVSSNNPELLRITAEENDGSFKAEETINIILEFNKAVKYSGGTPTLTLNVSKNGTFKIIECSSESEKELTQHKFTYTVEEGDNISALEVTKINTDGITWTSTVNKKDFTVDTTEMNNIVNDASKKLTGSRKLRIDTVKPLFNKLTAITKTGAYNKDKEIFIQGEFNEEVTIEDFSKLKLNFNTGATSTSAVKTGPSKVLFTYKIGENQNTSALDVTSVSVTGAGIKDIAGNEIADPISNSITKSGISSIKIDTTKPDKPVVTGITNNAYIYDPAGASFTITGFETDTETKKYYSVDGGKSYSEYTGTVTLGNGEYDITAYQEDAAGNKSDDATTVHINVDPGNILTSITAGVPTGTYTTGKVIPIYLNFRNKVTVAAGAKLTLNNGKEAVYSSGTGTTRAVFNYTVAEGDSSDGLNVTAFTDSEGTINAAGTFKDERNNDITSYCTVIPSGKNLSDSRTITIVTGKPVVQSVSYNKTTKKLTIAFDSNINKGSGNITITHGTGYRAPAVLAVDTFNNLNKKNSDYDLADYYELGVNGSDADGNPDTEEKYILKFAKNITDTDVLTALTKADADKVIIPVNSSYVTVSGANLIIELTDSYALPVQGAAYTISLPAALVSDKQSHTNDEDNTRSISSNVVGGVEDPVIRIEKKDETLSNINSTNNTMTVTQPLTASVKVECQTPGVTPTVAVQSQTNSQDAYTGTKITKKAYSLKNATIATTTSNGTVSMSLGSTDTTSGYIYKLTASANANDTTKTAYEYAYRSVYTMTNTQGMNADVTSHSGTYKQLYLRGGDNVSGGLSQSTFPVSWNTAQFDKIRAMTNSSGSTWYWVTWKVNVNSYMQPLRGNVPDDVGTKGPKRWCWCMQGPIPTGLENYILYPGQSLSIDGERNYKYERTSFYKKHCEYRDGDAVVKSMEE